MTVIFAVVIATSLSVLLSLFWIEVNGDKLKISYINIPNRNRIGIMTIIALLPMLFVSAFRFDYGVDYNLYEQIFDLIKIGRLTSERYPILYRLIYQVVISADGNFQQVIFFISTATILLVFFSIYKNSKNVPISILIFLVSDYYYESLSTFRQGMAVAICIFAIGYLKENKYLKFLICIGLAMGFHTTAIVFVLALLLQIFDIPNLIKCLIIVFVAVFKNQLLNIAAYVVSLVGYSKYYQSKYFDLSQDYITLTLINIIVFLMFLVIYYFYCKDKKDKLTKLYLNIQFLSTLCIALGAIVPECHRVMYYFYWYLLLSVPHFANKLPKISLRIIFYFIAIGLMSGYFFLVNYSAGYFDYSYYTIFSMR